ncbi:P-loop containing nucleoside triphosphate hydrolase protein, partial [Agrocybe pediades]
MKEEELEGLEDRIKEKFKWKHSPRDFQLQAIKLQLLRKDVLVHAGTGSGKTMIAAGPHAMTEPSKKMVTFMVSPLIALQEEQAKTFQDEFGLSAKAVNSLNDGCTAEIMDVSSFNRAHKAYTHSEINIQDICEGKWQIILISPEIILSVNFRDKVLLNPKMIPRILSVVVDEAHVVSHWGAEFRKEYGRLGVLRSILPKGTPFVAMSATLSRRIRRDVLKKLEFDEANYLPLDIGNDRSNVSIVVRAIHNTMNTFSDMDFIIPTGITKAEDIPLTFIYADKIIDGVGIEDRLTNLLPENLRNEGLIRPYSAAYSPDYREELMALFKAGVVRVLICTDAAGMVC